MRPTNGWEPAASGRSGAQPARCPTHSGTPPCRPCGRGRDSAAPWCFPQIPRPGARWFWQIVGRGCDDELLHPVRTGQRRDHQTGAPGDALPAVALAHPVSDVPAIVNVVVHAKPKVDMPQGACHFRVGAGQRAILAQRPCQKDEKLIRGRPGAVDHGGAARKPQLEFSIGQARQTIKNHAVSLPFKARPSTW